MGAEHANPRYSPPTLGKCEAVPTCRIHLRSVRRTRLGEWKNFRARMFVLLVRLQVAVWLSQK